MARAEHYFQTVAIFVAAAVDKRFPHMVGQWSANTNMFRVASEFSGVGPEGFVGILIEGVSNLTRRYPIQAPVAGNFTRKYAAGFAFHCGYMLVSITLGGFPSCLPFHHHLLYCTAPTSMVAKMSGIWFVCGKHRHLCPSGGINIATGPGVAHALQARRPSVRTEDISSLVDSLRDFE